MTHPLLTLAEIETSLRKAARACDYPWGLAEEAGKSARWLAAYGLPGAELVLAQLQAREGGEFDPVTPDCAQSPWRADAGLLCPIVTGATLGDRIGQLAGGGEINIADCARPLLLATALGQAAWRFGGAYGLAWDGVEIRNYPDGMAIEGSDDQLLVEQAALIVCREIPLDQGRRRLPSTGARPVDGEAWAAINALVFKTYVPATAASRAGAGSSLSDND